LSFDVTSQMRAAIDLADERLDQLCAETAALLLDDDARELAPVVVPAIGQKAGRLAVPLDDEARKAEDIDELAAPRLHPPAEGLRQQVLCPGQLGLGELTKHGGTLAPQKRTCPTPPMASRVRNLANQVGALPISANDVDRTRAPSS
jgi:hypothetical protein